MKQWLINTALALIFVVIIGVVCFVNAKELQPQKQTGAVTLDELYNVVTKDGKKYTDAKINLTHIGCFLISDKGYIYIPIENIKAITEVEHGSTNSVRDGGDVQRLPENR